MKRKHVHQYLVKVLAMTLFIIGSYNSAAQGEFITTWEVTSGDLTITIPTSGSGYNYKVDWGDSSVSNSQVGNSTHSYSLPGTYTVKISGDFPHFYIYGGPAKTQIRSVEQWGDNTWQSMNASFMGVTNFEINANDAPDLSNVDDMSNMFFEAKNFNSPINHWDVSNVTNMRGLFYANEEFNQSLANWDVSNVTNMDVMFQNAFKFNGDVSTWNTSSVTGMQAMFYYNYDFNQDLSNWNTSNVTTMFAMFQNARSFNADISGWDVGKVESFFQTFAGASSFNADIGVWNTTSATSMVNMLNSALNFNQDLSGWDVSSVTDMTSMFYNAQAFDGDLGTWDISSVTNMSFMLTGAGMSSQSYDATLTGWSNGNAIPSNISLGATNLTYCSGADARQSLIDDYNWSFVGDQENCPVSTGFITTWEVTAADLSIEIPTWGSGHNYNVDWGDGHVSSSHTTSASHTYASAGLYTVKINGDLRNLSMYSSPSKTKIRSVEQWGNIEWWSLGSAFAYVTDFEINAIDAPNLSQVTDLSIMFEGAKNFNSDISHWDVSTITNMAYMFAQTDSFNQDLNDWDVSNVQYMQDMFRLAKAFNQDLNNWDVSNVVNMGGMFAGAELFNKDISNWNTGNVTNMHSTFSHAYSFDINLSSWDISSVTDMSFMLPYSGLSTENYDQTLIGWANQPNAPINLNLNAYGLNYCEGQAARQSLIDDYYWTIEGDSKACPVLDSEKFITTWEVTSEDLSITIPADGSNNNFDVDWGDGTSSIGETGTPSHTYSAPGLYTVKISGILRWFGFSNGPGKDKIRSVEQWGDIEWWSMNSAYAGVTDFQINAPDAPNLSQVTSMSAMFRDAENFNSDISHWDVSNVQYMGSMFTRARSFDQPLNNWDVSSVVDMTSLFWQAESFNQDLDSWDVSNVTSMIGTFYNARSFNGNVTSWNTENVESMKFLFADASAFNQDLSNWNTSSVTNMSFMFSAAEVFTSDLSNWDVSNVTDMGAMFQLNEHFESDLSQWDVGQVSNMSFMFNGATKFDSNISSWNFANAVTIFAMFNRAASFDQNLGGIDISKITDMSFLFSWSGMSSENYDQTLIEWAAKTALPSNIVLGANGLEYCLGQSSRQILIDDYNWTITGDSEACTLLPPTVITKDITVFLEDNGNAVINAIDLDNGSTAPDGIASYEVDIDTFNCTHLDEPTVVILTVTSNDGISASDSALVTVLDSIAPTAVTQNITVSLGADGSVTIDPSDVDGGSFDNTECIILSLDRDTFDCVDIKGGSYYYTYDNDDDDGHSKGKGKGHNYDDDDDDDDNDPGKGKAYGHKKGKKKKKKGIRVVLTVTDAAGNSSSEVAYVTVVDDLAPEIGEGPLTVVVYSYKKGRGRKSRIYKPKTYLRERDVEAYVTDNCDDDPDVDVPKVKFTVDDAGINFVQVTAEDHHGNVGTGDVTVNVLDITSDLDYKGRVYVCYKGKSKRIYAKQVNYYLRKGAVLGSCGNMNMDTSDDLLVEEPIAEEILTTTPNLTVYANPNPASEKATVTFYSSVAGPAQVAVYDMQGVEVAKLFEGDLAAQRQVRVEMNVSDLPSGLLVIRFRSAGMLKTAKLIVQK